MNFIYFFCYLYIYFYSLFVLYVKNFRFSKCYRQVIHNQIKKNSNLGKLIITKVNFINNYNFLTNKYNVKLQLLFLYITSRIIILISLNNFNLIIFSSHNIYYVTFIIIIIIQ